MKLPRSSGKPRKHKVRWPLVVRRVRGHSMVPTLPPGTVILGWRWVGPLKAGDVVVFWRDGREIIKRIDRLDGLNLFVLGDHAETSTDSRHFGWISREAIVAKIVWPQTDPLKLQAR